MNICTCVNIIYIYIYICINGIATRASRQTWTFGHVEECARYAYLSVCTRAHLRHNYRHTQNTIQYDSVQYSTITYNGLCYSTMQCSMLRHIEMGIVRSNRVCQERMLCTRISTMRSLRFGDNLAKKKTSNGANIAEVWSDETLRRHEATMP